MQLLKKDKQCQKRVFESHQNKFSSAIKQNRIDQHMKLARLQQMHSSMRKSSQSHHTENQKQDFFRKIITSRDYQLQNTGNIKFNRHQLSAFRFDNINQIDNVRKDTQYLSLRQGDDCKPVIRLSMGSSGISKSSRNKKNYEIENLCYQVHQPELISSRYPIDSKRSSSYCYDQPVLINKDKLNKELNFFDLKQRIKHSQKLAQKCQSKIKSFKIKQQAIQKDQSLCSLTRKENNISQSQKHQTNKDYEIQCQLTITEKLQQQTIIKIKDKYIQSLNLTIQSLKESQQMASQNYLFEVQKLKKQLSLLQSQLEQLTIDNQILMKQRDKQKSQSFKNFESKITQLQQKVKLSAEYQQKQSILIQNLRDQVQTCKNNLFQQRLSHEANIKNMKQSMVDLQNDHSKQVSRLMNQVQKSKDQQLSVSYRELGHSFENKINELLQENQKLKNKIANMEGSLQQLEITSKSYEETIKAYEERDQSCQSSGVLQQQLREMRMQIQKLEQQKDTLTDQYQMKIMKLQNQVDSIKSDKSESGGSLNNMIKQQINQIQKLRSQLKIKSQQLFLLKRTK